MELVTEPSKKSIPYLKAILEHEQALMLAELQESKEINEYTAHVLKSLLEITNTHRGPVDWEAIEKRYKENRSVDEAFDKVKMS